ncbi:MAG: Crp/Fnr family transcriptional regulator [Patescibacteria group bacterium]|nr:Crp/Fnr family transcriptional regulator [Patescibacteria group bacterium]
MEQSWLKNVSIFSTVGKKELDDIIHTLIAKKFPIGEQIIQENEKTGTELFVIKKGRVKISRRSADGGEIVLAVLGPGDFFGEMSLLDGLARTADVTAMEPIEVMTIEKEQFLKILQRYPQISFGLLKILSGRLRSSDIKMQSVTITNAVGKLASFLLSLCDYSGKRVGKGVALVNVPPLKTIAETLSLKKIDISRGLQDFIKCGYMRRKNSNLVITDYLTFKKMYT